MECGCWEYFYGGIVTALMPSLLVLALIFLTTKPPDDDG